ncbi:MAG: hypothetical protein FWH12_01640 [Treponema sp.]|nr:hypothetical protein [Treponema sp.]
MSDFFGESDDARNANIEIFRKAQNGLDAWGRPFPMEDDDDDWDDWDEDD